MSASVNAAFGRIPHFLYVLVDSIRRPQGSPYSALSLGRQWIHVGGGVHSSSCGTHREVVHSPLDWFYHRCHCKYRDLVLFVGRLAALCAAGEFASRFRVVVVLLLVVLTILFGTV